MHDPLCIPNCVFLDFVEISRSQKSIHTKNSSIRCHFLGLKCDREELVRCCCSAVSSLLFSNFPGVCLPCLDSELSELGLVGKIVNSRM